MLFMNPKCISLIFLNWEHIKYLLKIYQNKKAIPLVINSCLLEEALDKGQEERIKFKEAYAE